MWKDFIVSLQNQDFLWNKGTHESLDIACLHLNVEILKMRQYLTNILKCETSSDNIKEQIYHWLYYFEKFHKKYIIMTTESCNS